MRRASSEPATQAIAVRPPRASRKTRPRLGPIVAGSRPRSPRASRTQAQVAADEDGESRGRGRRNSDSRRTRPKSTARLSKLARAAMSAARASSAAVGLSGTTTVRAGFSGKPSPSRSRTAFPGAKSLDRLSTSARAGWTRTTAAKAARSAFSWISLRGISPGFYHIPGREERRGALGAAFLAGGDRAVGRLARRRRTLRSQIQQVVGITKGL
ncbi:MAG: hypothetical protein M0C28_01945 [Candidatus Moduliflexus flocculans]|nr:hypothetical protein [Candidatus Moduliflexus flocculans]